MAILENIVIGFGVFVVPWVIGGLLIYGLHKFIVSLIHKHRKPTGRGSGRAHLDGPGSH